MCDSTFYPCRNTGFDQLWVVGGILTQPNNVRKLLVPFLFAYMKSKSAESYEFVIREFMKKTNVSLDIKVCPYISHLGLFEVYYMPHIVCGIYDI